MFGHLILAASSFAVGVFIGSAGVGGVLLIPALIAFAGLPVHAATASALFSFLFTGVAGAWLFRRRGSIDWAVSLPVCAGAFLLSATGALAASATRPAALQFAVAAIVLAAGLYVLLPVSRARATAPPAARSRAALFGLGAAAGFGAGFSGAGGPLFSVPLMVACGYEPLLAVGTGQVVQIAAALSGSVGNQLHGAIDYPTAVLVTVFELPGVALGTRLAHAVPAVWLRRTVGVLCLAAAAGLALRT
ncbi:MAG TPA: sulfite exporter TauE/SafE family protein [Burkholderiales bacterium]|nr:sulfite exporter TauE/SafE family protein [Burkholderiales bacterium]